MIDSISIRPFCERDVDGLFAAVRESISELVRWMPWCHPQYSLDETRTRVESRSAAWEAKTEFDFAIQSATGTILGCCGLNRIEHNNGTANLGYWVRTSATGQGVATRATELLRQWAFTQTALHRLEIMAAVDNRVSRRVAEKVGAVCEGTLRERLILRGRKHDAVLYSLVRTPDEVAHAEA